MLKQLLLRKTEYKMQILKYKKLISLILFIRILACEPIQAQSLEIEHADLLQADKQQILIKGNILVKYKGAIIEAPEGNIITNDEGKYDKAIFLGRAKLKLQDRKIEADKIIVSIKDRIIYAEGNTLSELSDKDNNLIITSCNYQELKWDGGNALAKGNLKTKYKDTAITSDEAKIIYKDNRPKQVIFTSKQSFANLTQPTSITSAKEFIIDINTHNVWAFGDVKSTIWTNQKISKQEQDSVYLNTENLYIDKSTGTIIAKAELNKVKISYQDTKGESKEATLLREKTHGNPERIIFKGSANVIQENKQISSEEVIFNFNDKKLTSNTKTNIRPKTIIYKEE